MIFIVSLAGYLTATMVSGEHSAGLSRQLDTTTRSENADQAIRKAAMTYGITEWQSNPNFTLDATDSHCETENSTSCKLHLEVHGADAAYTMGSGSQAIRLKQTSSSLTRRDAQGVEKTLSPQASASIPDFFPLPRLSKTLGDSSLNLTLSANDGGVITVTSEPANVRRQANDPLASLNTRRFKIDATTGELRAIEFTIASVGNAKLSKPAKVSYFNYKRAPSGVMYPEEIKFEIDGHLVNDYHVTQVDTTSTTFTEQ